MLKHSRIKQTFLSNNNVPAVFRLFLQFNFVAQDAYYCSDIYLDLWDFEIETSPYFAISYNFFYCVCLKISAGFIPEKFNSLY